MNIEDRIAVDQIIGVIREYLSSQSFCFVIKLALLSNRGQFVEQANDQVAMLTNDVLLRPQVSNTS